MDLVALAFPFLYFWQYIAKWNNLITEGQLLHDSTSMRLSKIVKFTEREQNGGFQEPGAGRNG